MSAPVVMAFPKRVFTSGAAALTDMRAAIAGARQRIWLEVSRIDDDQASRRLVRALRGRARAGVIVRVSCPRVHAMPDGMRRALTAAGVHVLVAPGGSSLFRRRDRAGPPLLVVDGRQAYVGAPWLAGGLGEERRPVRDEEQALSLRLDGALARKLEAWAFGDPGAPAIAGPGATTNPVDELIASSPALRTRFEAIAAAACGSLWISVPRGPLTPAAWSTVVAAARRGIDVRVAAPSTRWCGGLSRRRESTHPRGVRVHPTREGAGSNVVIADGGRVLVAAPTVGTRRDRRVIALASEDPALCDAIGRWFERRWDRLPVLGSAPSGRSVGWSSLGPDHRLPG